MWNKSDESPYHMKIVMKVVPTNFPGASTQSSENGAGPETESSVPEPGLAAGAGGGGSGGGGGAGGGTWRGRFMPARFRSILTQARSRTILNAEVRMVGSAVTSSAREQRCVPID